MMGQGAGGPTAAMGGMMAGMGLLGLLAVAVVVLLVAVLVGLLLRRRG